MYHKKLTKKEFVKEKIKESYVKKYNNLSKEEKEKRKQEYIKKKKKEYYYKKYKEESEKKKQEFIEKKKEEYRNCSRIIYKIANDKFKKIAKILKKTGTNKKYNKWNLFGCTPKIFENHLECQFEFGMHFKNYGAWLLIFKKPISEFDFKKNSDISKCFNYKNMIPIWDDEDYINYISD